MPATDVFLNVTFVQPGCGRDVGHDLIYRSTLDHPPLNLVSLVGATDSALSAMPEAAHRGVDHGTDAAGQSAVVSVGLMLSAHTVHSLRPSQPMYDANSWKAHRWMTAAWLNGVVTPRNWRALDSTV